MNLFVKWRLSDLMTPVMSKVTRTATSTQAVLQKANAAMNAGFQKTGKSVNDLQGKLKAVEGNHLKIVVDNRGIKRVNQDLNTLSQNMDRVSQKSRSGMGLKNMVAGLGIYKAGAAGIDILNRGMASDQAEQSFTYFTGSVEKAQKIMQQLEGFSKLNPMYNKGGLLQGAELIADTFGADNVMKLTNVTAKLARGNMANYMGILTRLQQIKGTGYLQGDELMELLNRGVFGLQEEIAKFRGVSMARFNKLKEQQQISYEEVEAALIRMTSAGGKYDKVLDVMTKTSMGKWLTIRNIVATKTAEMGKDVMRSLSGAMDWVIRLLSNTEPISTALNRLGRVFNPLLSSIYRVGVAFGIFKSTGDSATNVADLLARVVNASAWVMERLATAANWVAGTFEKYPWTKYVAGFLAVNYVLQSSQKRFMELASNAKIAWTALSSLNMAAIASKFSVLTSLVNGLRNAFIALNLSNPVMWIIAGVAALAAAFYIAYQKSETFRNVVDQTWEAAKMLWADIVKWVREAWVRIQPYITAIGKLWSMVWGVIGKVALAYWTYLKGMFSAITQPLVSAFEWAKEPIMKFWNWLKDSALKAMRITAGIMTGGLSEVAIWGYNKFKNDYYIPAGEDRQRKAKELERLRGQYQEVVARLPKQKNAVESLQSSTNTNNNLGAGIGKASGLTDTVNGSTSKNITINLNSKIADIYNTFNTADSPEDLGGKIADIVLMEINRILMTGNRLALE